MFFDDQLSVVTTGLGGLICLIISLTMIVYGTGRKPNHAKN
jgi:hypothetical protein